ncbi:hypothetical protein LAZ40_23115 [Cereibacter sphaeroides]|uniref:hypothetical protein n=1 Tax=Cereibacter sphaeroides TaxID=1063 RepID=UPI001F2AA0F0|nr:hypothetical protein [Cereibacter sphaeroides]MCE6961932.1 hypothetical protein [Cereibacter sphaeroides]MCE6975697.1 hypothetical protein [Cereibacter sphaeroides]
MFFPVEVTGRIPSLTQAHRRALDHAEAVLKPLTRAVAVPEATLAGLRVGFIGDAAIPGLVGLVHAMGGRAETAVLDGRRLPAHRRPDAVVVSWPSTTGNETAEWQQVALMRLDNPRLVVILLDWSKGGMFVPCHDLRIPRRATRATIRSILSELRLLRREQALAAETDASATVRPLFRRAPAAAVVSVPSYPCAKAA